MLSPPSILDPGNYFGEMSLLLNEPRAASCIANSHVRCHRLSRVDFELCAKNELATTLDKTVNRRQSEIRSSISASSMAGMLQPGSPTGSGTPMNAEEADAYPETSYEELKRINKTKSFGKYNPAKLEVRLRLIPLIPAGPSPLRCLFVWWG